MHKDFTTQSRKIKVCIAVLAAFIMLILCVRAILMGDNINAGVSGAMAIALILISDIQFLEEISLFGLQAKLRNTIGKAEDQIQEAADTLNAIQRTSIDLARLAGSQIAYSNRFADQGWRPKLEIVNSIKKNLRDQNAPESEIKEAFDEVIRFFVIDVIHILFFVISERFGQARGTLIALSNREDITVEQRNAANAALEDLGNIDAEFFKAATKQPLDTLPAIVDTLVVAINFSKTDLEKIRPFFQHTKDIINNIITTREISEKDLQFFERYRSSKQPSPAFSEMFGLDNQPQFPQDWL